MSKSAKIILWVIGVILVGWGGLTLFANQPQTLTKPGDVNVDGRVDCADVQIVHSALGAKNGDSAYAPGADINRDNMVDQNDLNIVLSHLPNGTRCPQ